jgi:hypothetical protein
MIHEQISFNGRPAIGFGDAVSEKKQLEAVFVPPLVGFLVGSIGGAVLGSLVEKGVGTAVGTIAGGVGGAAVGLVVGYHLAHPDSAVATSTPATPTPWRRIPVEDIAKLKSGQQYAVAVALANGAPLLPADIASIDLQFTALKTAPVNLPFKNFASYPPGAKLPSDWPKDDDLGPNAYRISADLIADAPADAAGLKNINTESFAADGLAAEVWVRDTPK